MTFDFDAAMERAKKDANSTALEAIVLAPSGGGKSYLAGTFGCKTLYVFSSGETHGVKAAKTADAGSSNLVPFRYDYNASGDSDAALANLLVGLRDQAKLKALGIAAVYIDGASELEWLIRNSVAWKDACKTSKGGHNTFEEPRATITLFRPIIVALKDLQRDLGIHVAMSCVLDVREFGEDGAIVECMPRLIGYSVAESLIQQFGDTLVVGRMTRGGERKHKLQFMTDVSKTSKSETGVVKKTINFSPRISGVPLDTLKHYMDASLADVIELKRKAFK